MVDAEKTRVIIVGSGAIGALIALNLAEDKSFKVTKFGGRVHPGEASSVAGAMLGVYGEITKDTFANDFMQDRFMLDKLAKSRWDGIIEDLDEVGEDPIGVADSTVLMHNAVGSSSVDDANWNSIITALDRDSAPYDRLKATDFESIGVKPSSLERPMEGVLIHQERAIDPRALLVSITRRFHQMGGVDDDRLVRKIEVERGRVRGVVSDDGEFIAADVVVVAAGAFSSTLIDPIPELEDVPPIFSGAGVSVLVEKGPAGLSPYVLRTPNRAFACGLHAIPRHSGEWYLGATNHLVASPVHHALFEDLRFVLDCAQGQVHRGFADSRVVNVYAGNRPVSADGAPIIGETRIEGLILATGTYREGVHLSPVIGDHIGGILRGESKYEKEFRSFSPHRLPHSRNRKETVIDTVNQSIATGDEYKWIVPHTVEESLRHAWSIHFEEMLSRLPGGVVPPPEILTVLHTQHELRRRLIKYYELIGN